MPELIPCKHIFSNGSEFEWFIETQCMKCKRLRNGKCRIYNACLDAQYDSSKFPYDDLLDYAGGMAMRLTNNGAICQVKAKEQARLQKWQSAQKRKQKCGKKNGRLQIMHKL